MPQLKKVERPSRRPKTRIKHSGYVHAAFGIIDVLVILVAQPSLFWGAAVLLMSFVMDLAWMLAMKQRKRVHDDTWKQIQSEGVIAMGRKHRVTLAPVPVAIFAAAVCLYYALITDSVQVRVHETPITSTPNIYKAPKPVLKVYNIPVSKIMLALMLFSLVAAVWLYIDWKSKIRIVTNQRVIRLRDPPLLLPFMKFRLDGWDRVLLTNVSFDIVFPGDMMDYGDVKFETQSQRDSQVTLSWVPSPDIFAHQIDTSAVKRSVIRR